VASLAVGAVPSEFERLKVELELQKARIQEQEGRMEADRREREQRNHELQLKMLESIGARGASAGPSMTELVTAVKSLKDLSGNGSALASVKEMLDVAEHLNSFRGAQPNEEDGGWLSWLKPIAIEAGRAIAPALAGSLINSRIPVPVGSAATAMGSAEPTQPMHTPGSVNGGDLGQTAAAGGASAVANEQYLAARRQAIALALGVAKLNRAAGFYAEMMLEQGEVTNDPLIVQIVREIRDAKAFQSWFADLEKVEPAVTLHQRWFGEFFETVQSALAGQEHRDGTE
jgi:hypothetical protein